MDKSSLSVTSQEIAAIELNAKYLGVSSSCLMENAGCAVASQISSRFGADQTRVVILAGTGGKGGDGMVAARHLAGHGFKVSLVLVGRPEQFRREEVKRNWAVLQLLVDSVSISVADDSSLIPAIEGEVIVDALLGTGFRGQLKPPFTQAVAAINKASGFKLSIDLPTGVDPDTGAVLGDAVKANLTVTFHKPKRGVLRASAYTGEIVVASIGIPPEAENHIGPGDVLLVSRERPRDARKGDFGRLLVIGGSKQFHGAPTLAAMAAMRTGVDLVYVAVPEAVAHDVAAASPALIVVKLHGSILTRNSLDDLNPFLSRCSAVVLGPGLGILPETKEAVLKVVEMVEDKGIPLLLDADGLKAFAEFKQPTKCPLVLTPHRGEYELLSNERLPETLVEQVRHIESTARKLKAVLLVKGPIDFVSDGVRTKLNRYVHNPAMTVGGTGDVLSGIVGGLLSQGFDPFRSAAAGTFINGAAGDFAYKERGNHLLPDDLVDWIPKVMNSPMSHISVRHL